MKVHNFLPNVVEYHLKYQLRIPQYFWGGLSFVPTNKNIRNMHAILTNQITDIWHFNDKLSILFTDDILLFVEYLKTFSRNNFLICPPSWLEGARKIYNSSSFIITDLAFCIAVSTSSTIKTNFNKLKLCIWIFFNNIRLNTSENNFF